MANKMRARTTKNGRDRADRQEDARIRNIEDPRTELPESAQSRSPRKQGQAITIGSMVGDALKDFKIEQKGAPKEVEVVAKHLDLLQKLMKERIPFERWNGQEVKLFAWEDEVKTWEIPQETRKWLNHFKAWRVDRMTHTRILSFSSLQYASMKALRGVMNL